MFHTSWTELSLGEHRPCTIVLWACEWDNESVVILAFKVAIIHSEEER